MAYDRAATMLLGPSAVLNFKDAGGGARDGAAVLHTAIVMQQALGDDAPPVVRELVRAASRRPGGADSPRSDHQQAPAPAPAAAPAVARTLLQQLQPAGAPAQMGSLLLQCIAAHEQQQQQQQQQQQCSDPSRLVAQSLSTLLTAASATATSAHQQPPPAAAAAAFDPAAFLLSLQAAANGHVPPALPPPSPATAAAAEWLRPAPAAVLDLPLIEKMRDAAMLAAASSGRAADSGSRPGSPSGDDAAASCATAVLLRAATASCELPTSSRQPSLEPPTARGPTPPPADRGSPAVRRAAFATAMDCISGLLREDPGLLAHYLAVHQSGGGALEGGSCSTAAAAAAAVAAGAAGKRAAAPKPGLTPTPADTTTGDSHDRDHEREAVAGILGLARERPAPDGAEAPPARRCRLEAPLAVAPAPAADLASLQSLLAPNLLSAFGFAVQARAAVTAAAQLGCLAASL
jgi:hypothetical protein